MASLEFFLASNRLRVYQIHHRAFGQHGQDSLDDLAIDEAFDTVGSSGLAIDKDQFVPFGLFWACLPQ